MDISTLVEKTIGLYFLILGISLVIRPSLWLKVVKRIVQEESAHRGYFFFTLIIGVIVILTHNIWDFTSAALVTVFGWALLIKSIIAFIYPELFKMLLPKKDILHTWIRIWGVFLVALCCWILIPFYGPGTRFF